MSACSAASTGGVRDHRSRSAGSRPASRAAPAISSGSSSRPPAIVRIRSRRSSADASVGCVQPRGGDGAAGGLRRGRARVRARLDRHPVRALQPGRAVGELLGLTRLVRQHDHPVDPGELVAVVPAQALAHGLHRERERARGIREVGDLEHHVSGYPRTGLSLMAFMATRRRAGVPWPGTCPNPVRHSARGRRSARARRA